MSSNQPPVLRILLAMAAIALPAAAACAQASAVRLKPIDELVPVAVLKLGDTADWVAITSEAVWTGSTGPNAVHRVDPRTNQRIATVPLPGEPCAGLAAGFGSLWVPLCTKPATLAKVDLERNTLTAVLRTGPAAAEGGIIAGSDSIWMVTDAKGSLLRLDPHTGAVTQRIRLPAGSYNLERANGRIWATRAEGAEVTAIDEASGKVVASTTTGPRPRFLAAGAGAIWTLNQGDGSLSAVDAATAVPAGGIALGVSGSGGDIAFADDLLWITVRRIPLSVVDARSRTLLCQWVGAGGDSLRLGFGSIWLTDYTGGTLTRYDTADATRRCRPRDLSIIGTWRLIRYEDRSENTPPRFPYGAHPQGQLMYDATGHMSIQIMGIPHPTVASGDDTQVTEREKIALFDAYTAYFGTYEIDAARGVMRTRVQGDLADVFVGRVEERPFQLQGDRLTLTPVWDENGKRWEGIRVFERVK